MNEVYTLHTNHQIHLLIKVCFSYKLLNIRQTHNMKIDPSNYLIHWKYKQPNLFQIQNTFMK